MSLLFDLVGQLAPHASFFAGRMADGVMQGVIERITTRSVDGGEEVFRRLIERNGAGPDGLTEPDAAELDSLLDRLSDSDRVRLAAALAAWLDGSPDRTDLMDLVRPQQPAPGASVSVVSRGDNNTVIGNVGTFNQQPRDGA